MAKQSIKLGEPVKSAVAKTNANFTELYTEVASKVDAVDGKGLSTNDYTNDDKNKLAGIAAGAQANVLESIKVNGTALSVTDKSVNIDLSTYATTTAMNAALEDKVDAVSGKGLSTNDYTNEEKSKLAGLSAPSEISFTTSTWGTVSDGYYTATIAASGKHPVKVFRNDNGVYDEAVVQASVSGTNIVLVSEEAFAGYVLAI